MNMRLRNLESYKERASNESDTESVYSASNSKLSTTTNSTPATDSSGSAKVIEPSSLDRYIALGCLRYDSPIIVESDASLEIEWRELLHPDLPEEVKVLIGNEASRLLDARWVRLFLHQPASSSPQLGSLIRVYVLPEDWGRRYINRNSKSLKAALRQLLSQVDISPSTWAGNPAKKEIHRFDPWAGTQHLSLYYLFNKLPSPSPTPHIIKNRFTRVAVQDLLKSAAYSEWEEHGEQPLAGLKTRLYPYQARSASLMIQREASPILQVDPRLEARTSPSGETFYFGARDGSFLQQPRYYESNRGGILAETMGLGKTIICLAVILATKGHYPVIPAAYQPSIPIRSRVGTLADMAASTLGRYSIPAKAYLEQSETNGENDFTNMKNALNRNIAFYKIPQESARLNRTTRIPPPRQFVTCSATIIVVPRNLLHQWQSEIQKHVLSGALKILVVDSVPKRGGKTKVIFQDDNMTFRSQLPEPTELMSYDVILFTRNRFEQEILDGADDQGRRIAAGAVRTCNCPYVGSTRIPNCNCVDSDTMYESPLKKLHWLRIIIDEGHSFSSSVSNAVLVGKQIQAERRWVVSGTPAKNLVGVEIDVSTLETDQADSTLLRETVIEQRKTFNSDQETSKAAKALGMLASNFLMVRPWYDSGSEGRLDWEEHIYRHEHQYRKTFSGFSTCFVRILEGLVIKTRPEDVDRDIILPPMRHRVVYLKPCLFDKMTANLFIQVLRSNAITSERTDVDYLFHKNSLKARHSLIRNLRQSNFTWTGFSELDVASTLETSDKYLTKDDNKCSPEDAASLRESSQAVSKIAASEGWKALSKAHEVGMAVENWPTEVEEIFGLTYPAKPTMVGITELLDAQLHIDSSILSHSPTDGLDLVGHASRAKVIALSERDNDASNKKDQESGDTLLERTGVPSSCIDGKQPLTSRRASAILRTTSPPETEETKTAMTPKDMAPSKSPAKPKKRKPSLAVEAAELPANSPLRETCVVGTTSAKLTYLLEKVMQYQATDKIIIFYDGDNAAFYIAQCLEMFYVNHRIYARTLDNTTRSAYVALFNEDPELRVLLIDVACGALGLNLNVATVVLIVNPINRPGIEAQAIKRAHRIGQMREVLVETLVLENTTEHAIFDHAKKMSRRQHFEAKELEDDEGIIKIIQNAQILSEDADENEGLNSFALFKTPQQVFGRPNRHKFHRYGFTDSKTAGKRKQKATTFKSSKMAKKNNERDIVVLDGPIGSNSSVGVFASQAGDGAAQSQVSSIFGTG